MSVTFVEFCQQGITLLVPGRFASFDPCFARYSPRSLGTGPPFLPRHKTTLLHRLRTQPPPCRLLILPLPISTGTTGRLAVLSPYPERKELPFVSLGLFVLVLLIVLIFIILVVRARGPLGLGEPPEEGFIVPCSMKLILSREAIGKRVD